MVNTRGTWEMHKIFLLVEINMEQEEEKNGHWISQRKTKKTGIARLSRRKVKTIYPHSKQAYE